MARGTRQVFVVEDGKRVTRRLGLRGRAKAAGYVDGGLPKGVELEETAAADEDADDDPVPDRPEDDMIPDDPSEPETERPEDD